MEKPDDTLEKVSDEKPVPRKKEWRKGCSTMDTTLSNISIDSIENYSSPRSTSTINSQLKGKESQFVIFHYHAMSQIGGSPW